MTVDYTTITELPGSKVTKLQLERAYHRYMFGASFCDGKDVLEVACGGGQGLGLLARVARSVVGGDCENGNLFYAAQTYKNKQNIKVVKLDAHKLDFPDACFDVVLLYEAIYYLKEPERFFGECGRVLRNGGVLIICTANKDWPDFNPSPFSYKYFSVPELNALCAANGFNAEFYGSFPDVHNSFSDKLKSAVKQSAIKLHLMPKTMKWKVLLKRIFGGPLVELPWDLANENLKFKPPRKISCRAIDTVHTAIFAVCKKT